MRVFIVRVSGAFLVNMLRNGLCSSVVVEDPIPEDAQLIPSLILSIIL